MNLPDTLLDNTQQDQSNSNTNVSQDQQIAPVEFDIEGKKVKYDELKPELVKQWYETHTNQSNFSKKNTQEAQKIASEREKLKNYIAVIDRINADPELAESLINGVKSKNIDPAVKRELDANRVFREQTEREKIFNEFKSNDPQFKNDEFEEFAKSIDYQDKKQLFSMLYNAFKFTKMNINSIKKQAIDEYIQKQKDIKDGNLMQASNSQGTGTKTIRPKGKRMSDIVDALLE